MRARLVGMAVVVVAMGGCGTSAEVDELFASGGVEPHPFAGAAGTTEGRDGSAGGAAGQGGANGDGGATGSGGEPGAGEGGGSGDAGSAGLGAGGGAVDAARPRSDAGDEGPATPPGASDGGPLRTIRCGTATCDVATEYCCAEAGNFRCFRRTLTAACPRFVERVFCDERSDCASGQFCCIVENAPEQRDDATCVADCPPVLRVCDPARPGGCDAPLVCGGTSILLPDYPVCRRGP